MTPEEEAKYIIYELKYVVEDLGRVASGKHYTEEVAKLTIESRKSHLVELGSELK
jgi:hypothetical protein